MSNFKAPIDIYTRAKDESELYREAYLIALAKPAITESGRANDAPEDVAERAVKHYRAWLVSEGYTDLNETT